jgi:hypothetical protein
VCPSACVVDDWLVEPWSWWLCESAEWSCEPLSPESALAVSLLLSEPASDPPSLAPELALSPPELLELLPSADALSPSPEDALLSPVEPSLADAAPRIARGALRAPAADCEEFDPTATMMPSVNRGRHGMTPSGRHGQR